MARDAKRPSTSVDPDSDNENVQAKRVKLERLADDDDDDDVDDRSTGDGRQSPDEEEEDSDMEEDRDASDLDTDFEDDAANLRAKNAADEKKQKNGWGAVPQAGVIKAIKIVNFMCHKHFTYRHFGAKVNFIVGHNGSGKSAILTALAVALGAKASVTGRGQGIKDMVARDAEKATITLTLANNGMEAFMPEKYPGAIVIERWIDKNGSSGYKFRATEDGKILSTKRDELVQICSHFNIEIDSPLTLLTQDNAKTFLASTDDRKLYEFFFRGTSLQQLADNYTAVDQQQRRIQKDLETASESIPDQQTKVDRLQKEIAAAQKARDLKTRKVECEQKLAWAYVTRKEHVSDQQLARAEQQDIEAQRQEVTTLEKKVVLCQERIDEKLAEEGPIEAKLRSLNEELQELKAQREPARLLAKKAKDELNACKRKGAENEDNMKSLYDDIQKKRKEVVEVEKQIAARDLNAGGEDPRLKEKQERRKKMEQLVSNMRRSVPATERTVAEARTALDTAKVQSDELRNRLDDINGQKARVEGTIATLERQTTNRLGVYGQGIEIVMNEINKTRWHHSPPLGPLGQYVQLEDPKYGDVAHSVLAQTLCGFAVRCKEDKHTLMKILERLTLNHRFKSVTGRIPTIYVHTGDMFDFSSGNLSNLGTTLLSKLTVSNDVALRILVNASHIERVMLAPDRQTATNMGVDLVQRPGVDRLVVFSADLYSQTFRRDGGKLGGPLERWRRGPLLVKDAAAELANRREQLNALIPEKQRALDEGAKQTRRVRDLEAKLAEANRGLERIKTGLPKVRADLQKVEDEISELQPVNGDLLRDLKNEHEKELRGMEGDMSILEETAKTLAREEKAAVKKSTDLAAEEEAFLPATVTKREAMTVLAGQQSEAKRHRTHFTKSKERFETEVNAAQALIATAEAELEAWTEQARGFCEVRVETDETVEELDRRRNELEKAIELAKKQNNVDLDDMLAKFNEARTQLETMKEHIKHFQALVMVLQEATKKRQFRWLELRQHLAVRVRTSFIEFVNKRGFEGRLIFDHENQALSIRVQTTGLHATQGAQTQSRYKAPLSLSGGERSFSTISFLLALWGVAPTTISCLDEWDVFLDSANRSVAARMLIEGAKESHGKQFVLITPLDMGGVDVAGDDNRVIRLSDPERGQQTLDA